MPPIFRNCLGVDPPRRRPDPAAITRATTRISSGFSDLVMIVARKVRGKGHGLLARPEIES